MWDPYFLGNVTAPPPAHLPLLITTSPFLSHLYRMLVSLVGISIALRAIFNLSPLFFVGVLGQNWLGLRAEPWMYSDLFGSPMYLLKTGLIGWWGAFWHQIFRFGFEAPTVFILRHLGWDRRSVKARVAMTLVGFFLSGMLHAAGSYTSWPTSYPILPLAFFVLQAFGVIVEAATLRYLRLTRLYHHTPGWARIGSRIIFLSIWMLCTAPLLVDDFARSGIWLTEPVPVSVIRGIAGKRWWCWHGGNLRLHTGDSWWKSGLAV